MSAVKYSVEDRVAYISMNWPERRNAFKRLNLVNRVVPHERLFEEADALVRKIFGDAPLVMRAIKEIAVRRREMNMGDWVRFAVTLGEQIRQSADANEGLAAFREERQPAWQGR